MAEVSRRSVTTGALALSAGALSAGCAARGSEMTATGSQLSSVFSPVGASAESLARDESYWSRVAALYDTPEGVTQLENGYWGAMARPVRDAYIGHTVRVNTQSSYYARREFGADVARVRSRVAAALGAAPEEIVFTRNATEALLALISGYNKLKPGDAVLYADTDYDSMQDCMEWLRVRRGVEVIKIATPLPATREAIVENYSEALRAHPNVRLVLLTHVSHRTGLRLPVAEVSEVCRAHGADCILDSAHAWGQLDFKVGDLKVDFAGFNLHKWIGAPLGVGLMYVKAGRVGDVDPYMTMQDSASIEARVHTGTADFAAYLAAPDALDLHEAIGAANKQARLSRLRSLWTTPVRQIEALEVLTPEDPGLSSAIAAVRLRGKTSAADAIALSRRLLDEFGIFTIHRMGLASGACVRIAPALFTREADIARLVEALTAIARSA